MDLWLGCSDPGGRAAATSVRVARRLHDGQRKLEVDTDVPGLSCNIGKGDGLDASLDPPAPRVEEIQCEESDEPLV
jgi:hypothetical protein